MRLLEDETNGCGVLEDGAGRRGCGSCDSDGVGFGGQRESVGRADAISAADGGKQRHGEECDHGEFYLDPPGARMNRKADYWEKEECPNDRAMHEAVPGYGSVWGRDG